MWRFKRLTKFKVGVKLLKEPQNFNSRNFRKDASSLKQGKSSACTCKVNTEVVFDGIQNN